MNGEAAMDIDSIDVDADHSTVSSYSPRMLLNVLPSSSANTIHHHPQVQPL